MYLDTIWTILNGVSNLEKKMWNILNSCGKPIFQTFSDASKKIQELSLKCIILLCDGVFNMTEYVAFLMPAILARYLYVCFDVNIGIFIHNKEEHNKFKWGVATKRQNKIGVISRESHKIMVKPSEEVHVLLCGVIRLTITAFVAQGTVSILHPYFNEIVFLCNQIWSTLIHKWR